MPGRPITDQQHRLYMTLRQKHPQTTAAAMAGFSPGTGHRAETVPRLPSERGRERRQARPASRSLGEGDRAPPARHAQLEADHRAGGDPAAAPRARPDVGPSIGMEPGPSSSGCGCGTPSTGRIERSSSGRTIRRDGRACPISHAYWHGGARDLAVTIAGALLAHLIYHFALVYSVWEHAEVVLGGESFAALSAGLQNAVWQLGGVPAEHRTDSLAAAFANLERDARPGTRPRGHPRPLRGPLRRRRHGADAQQPRPCLEVEAHENGSIESRHGHLKTRLDQALQLRGARDFDTLDDRRAFIAQVVGRHNARRRDALRIEAPQLRPLPPRRSCDFDEATVRVTSSGGRPRQVRARRLTLAAVRRGSRGTGPAGWHRAARRANPSARRRADLHARIPRDYLRPSRERARLAEPGAAAAIGQEARGDHVGGGRPGRRRAEPEFLAPLPESPASHPTRAAPRQLVTRSMAGACQSPFNAASFGQ